MTLKPGTYRLAWGVHDEETGAITTRDQAIVIPDYSVPGLQLTAPLIAEPPHPGDDEPIRTDPMKSFSAMD